jgi:hypothetical protein
VTKVRVWIYNYKVMHFHTPVKDGTRYGVHAMVCINHMSEVFSYPVGRIGTEIKL